MLFLHVTTEWNIDILRFRRAYYPFTSHGVKWGTHRRVFWQRKKSLTSHEGRMGEGGEWERGLREVGGSHLPLLSPPPPFPQSRKVWPLNSELYETEVLDGRPGGREGRRRRVGRGQKVWEKGGGGRKGEAGGLLLPLLPLPPPPSWLQSEDRKFVQVRRRHDKPSFFLHMSLRLIARSLR